MVSEKARKIPINENLWAINEWMLNLNAFQIFIMGEPVAWDKQDNPDWQLGVEHSMAGRLIKNIRVLTNINPKKPILVLMKSEGGDWVEGMAMFDVIKNCSNKITILDYSEAMSMTSIIMQAADKRVMMPHSYFMFHEGTTGFEGVPKQDRSRIKYEEICKNQMLDIYVHALKKRGKKYNRWSEKKIQRMLEEHMEREEDVYLTPAEALQWGFIDEIFDGNWDKLLKSYPRVRE